MASGTRIQGFRNETGGGGGVCIMYEQDLDFVVVCGVFLFICIVLFGITESVMRAARKRKRRRYDA